VPSDPPAPAVAAFDCACNVRGMCLAHFGEIPPARRPALAERYGVRLSYSEARLLDVNADRGDRRKRS